VQSESNTAALNDLKAVMKKIKDSIQLMQAVADKKTDTFGLGILKSQLEKYQQLIGEYQLMVDNKPPALLLVEKARPSLKPDKPKRIEILIATLVLSFLFAIAIALILERRKKLLQ
jgi:septal ring factor EnvC (AmiA/AmiB activator)